MNEFVAIEEIVEEPELRELVVVALHLVAPLLMKSQSLNCSCLSSDVASSTMLRVLALQAFTIAMGILKSTSQAPR